MFQSILDLHNAGRLASRQAVVAATALTYGVVDDHIKRMLEDGRLRRVAPGIVEPVEVLPPARAVSFTKLPSGMGKLEIGDVCIDLVPAEERVIGRLLAGSAAELSGALGMRDLIDSVADLRRRIGRDAALSDS